MTAERQCLRLVVAGHVDHGKSTVLGRLLHDSASLPQGKLEQVRAHCQSNSRPFEYAFLLDAMRDEQAQGITMDAARIHFKTDKRDYLIIDAPGHREFLKNMVSGASQAHAAMLVLDAQEGIQENSKRHGVLLPMLGVQHVVVLINKMDLVGYRQDAYEHLARTYGAFLKQAGVTPAHFIPVSGLQGDNLYTPSKRTPWYSGPTLTQAMDEFPNEVHLLSQPFRMSVQDVYKFTENNDARRIIAGSVSSGAAETGDEIVFYPSGKSSRIKSVEGMSRPEPGKIQAGSPCGLTLQEQIYVRRGDLASLKKEPPPCVSNRVRVSLIWLGQSNLTLGKIYLLKVATSRTKARLEIIHHRMDATTLEEHPRPAHVQPGEIAVCTFQLDAPIAFDVRENYLETRRFVLVDGHEIGGGGLVLQALQDRQSWFRDKIILRNTKWQKSLIPAQERKRRYGHAPVAIIVTGPRESRRKDVAKALELFFFSQGRFAYLLGIGNLLYGVDADIRSESHDHFEDIRRLSEVSHILLDAGMILILSAAELTQEDLEIVHMGVGREHVATVWIGRDEEIDIKPHFRFQDESIERIVSCLQSWLVEKGVLFSGELEIGPAHE